MTALVWLIGIVAAGYGGVLVLMYVFQRAMMYFPDPSRIAPQQAGLPQAQEVELTSSDGEKLIAWYVAPRGDKPLVLYFQGNAEGLAARAGRFAWMIADGDGLLALNYRGYGGSTGKPSEDGLIRDATAAYDFARARYPAKRIVLFGESLGTAVAVALAAGHEIGALILDAPFTSAAAVGAAAYPFAPVRRLMKDTFRSDERIGRVCRAAFGACTAKPTASCRSVSAKHCSRWRASPSASCASRKAATSISTTTAPPAWCGNSSRKHTAPGLHR